MSTHNPVLRISKSVREIGLVGSDHQFDPDTNNALYCCWCHISIRTQQY